MAYSRICKKKRSVSKKSNESKTIKKCKTGKIKHNITAVDDIRFDSKLESDYYIHLKKLKEEGIVKNFELQPKFLLQDKFIIFEGNVIEGSHPDFKSIKRKNELEVTRSIIYKADFKVEYESGLVEIVDTKGIETADFKIKKKMFKYKYPNLQLKVITHYKGEWIDYELYKNYKREEKKKSKI